MFAGDIALQIIKKRAMLNKQRSFFMLQMFTVSLIEVFYDLRLSEAVNNCICTG